MTITGYALSIITAFVLGGLVGAKVSSAEPSLSSEKPSTAKIVAPSWKIFTAPDGRFTVLMPGKPKIETQIQKTHLGEVELQMFVVQPPEQEVVYLVAYNDFPESYAQMTTPQIILRDAQTIALKMTQSNLIRQRNIRSSNGHPGREIEYVNPGGKITKNRMYVAEGRLYQVMVITTRNQQRTLSRTMNGFLNSFQVVLQK